jgi:hypothetical protein
MNRQRFSEVTGVSFAACAALFLAVQPPATGQDKADSPKWKFKAVPFESDEKESTKQLNDLAADCWQYVGPFAHGVVAFKRRASAALPNRADLATEFQKLELVPRAQGERDVCSLFAITAIAEFEWARNGQQPRQQFSEEFLIWAGNEAFGLKGDQAMFYKAVHGLNCFGICSNELMPYEAKPTAKRSPSAKALADANGRAERWKVEWIKRWDVKCSLGQKELLAIKASLASGHPVACGLRWPKALKGHELLQLPGADGVFDGHSIVFTGYKDDPSQAGGGILQFRNSWGPRWGKSGYGVMSYAYAQAYANDALTLQLGPPKSEVPVKRFEAEALPVLARDRCDTNSQDMGGWGARCGARASNSSAGPKKAGSWSWALRSARPVHTGFGFWPLPPPTSARFELPWRARSWKGSLTSTAAVFVRPVR